jgi:hypothetical protein
MEFGETAEDAWAPFRAVRGRPTLSTSSKATLEKGAMSRY